MWITISAVQQSHNVDLTPSSLTSIEQWGAVKWTSFDNAFIDCSNLTVTAVDMPNLTSVTGMENMFYNCVKLNHIPNIENWNTSNVTNMRGLFFQTKFNQSIGGWNTSNVIYMRNMFAYAYDFNQPIGNWNTAKVTDMSSMFYLAKSFNQSIGGWNTANVTDMSRMFISATGFNMPLGNWNTANVTNMNYMFNNATAFNQSIGGWNVAKLENMRNMFAGATAFNQPLTNWNNVIMYDMRNMFDGATAFNQNLAAWGSKISTDSDLDNMLDNSGLSIANYEATLKGFSITTATGRVFGALGLKYCSNSSARNTLSSTGLGGKSWNIVGDMVSTVPSTIIVTQPVSQIIQPNSIASLSISATGDNLMYLWNSNETVSAISGKSEGIYTVTVSGTCGSVVSNAATIVGLSISSASVTGISINGNVVSITSPVTITINGTGFAQGVTVTVNGVALSVVSVSPTSILVNLPSGVITTTSVNVQITNPNQVASVSVSVVPVNVSPTSTNLPTYQSTSFSVYPNPTSNGEWRIENGEVGATMYVFNALGTIVYTQTIVSTSTEVSAKLSSGIYLVKVGTQIVKLVVE